MSNVCLIANVFFFFVNLQLNYNFFWFTRTKHQGNSIQSI